MIANFVGFVIIPALLIAAGLWDLTRYSIPNQIPVALALAFLAISLGYGLTWGGIGLHLAAGAVALLVGFAMFALGWIGGGDAKLFAATALILGPLVTLDYTLLAAIFGGALAVALLFVRQYPLPTSLSTHGWLVRLHDARQGVPYGVALASAALVIIFQGNLLHIIAS